MASTGRQAAQHGLTDGSLAPFKKIGSAITPWLGVASTGRQAAQHGLTDGSLAPFKKIGRAIARPHGWLACAIQKGWELCQDHAGAPRLSLGPTLSLSPSRSRSLSHSLALFLTPSPLYTW